MTNLDKQDLNDGTFSVLVYKGSENIIVMAEGTTDEIDTLYDSIESVYNDNGTAFKKLTIAKEEYTAKKNHLPLLNTYLTNKINE